MSKRPAPCGCECEQDVATVTDRLVLGGRQIYFRYKVRTSCRDEIGLEKPLESHVVPDNPASPKAPSTSCRWTIKIWRDPADKEPQSDDVRIEYVQWYAGANRRIRKQVPAKGALTDTYPAAYGCGPVTMSVLVEVGKVGDEHTIPRLLTFKGCAPCPPPRLARPAEPDLDETFDG